MVNIFAASVYRILSLKSENCGFVMMLKIRIKIEVNCGYVLPRLVGTQVAQSS